MTRVVDCQWHWYPPVFFEAQLGARDGFPRTERVAGGFVHHVGPGASRPFGPLQCDLEVQLAEAAAAGIDTVVASPASIGVDRLPAAQAREVAEAVNAAYGEAQRRYPDRFAGLATVPFHEPAGAIEVLDQAILRHGLRGLFVHSNVAGEPLDSPRLRPVLARAAELGAPLFLHPTRTVFADRLDRFGLDFVLGFPFETTVAAVTLVLGGVLDELPGLKVVHPHLGATVPMLAERIDFESSRPWAGNPPRERRPSEVLRTFWTDTVSRSPDALALATRFYGPDRIMLATDFPWWPAGEGVALVTEHAGEHLEAFLGVNACRLLGL